MGFGISPGLSLTAKTMLETNSCCFSLRPSSTAKQTTTLRPLRRSSVCEEPNPNLTLLELLAGREVYHANVRSSCVVMILQTLHSVKWMAHNKTPLVYTMRSSVANQKLWYGHAEQCMKFFFSFFHLKIDREF
jgi:hypothetical protein